MIGRDEEVKQTEEAGQLAEQVRRQTYAMLLFDEIEKAHPDVFSALLQILDDGRLTDAQGRTVDVKNTVAVMTSNIGADRILSAGAADYAKVRNSVMPALQQHFRPGFLNRIDEIIVFRGLERGQLRQIVDLLLERTRRRLHAQDISLAPRPAAGIGRCIRAGQRWRTVAGAGEGAARTGCGPGCCRTRVSLPTFGSAAEHGPRTQGARPVPRPDKAARDRR